MKNTGKYIAVGIAILASLAMRIGVMKGGASYNLAAKDAEIVLSSAIASNHSVAPSNFKENVHVTAYSSRVEETDDTPFITASGKRVRDGIVAANWLPFGTKVKIPQLFGDKIFIVEDRMHRKNSDKLDIWFAETKDALRFGVKRATIEIL